MASHRAAAAVWVAYNVLLALLWAGIGLRDPLGLAHPHSAVVAVIAIAAAVLAHLALTALPSLLRSTPVADVYPAFAVIGIWTEMGLILPRLHPDGASLRDAAALRLDALLFGTHWHTEWIARMPGLSGFMYLAYCSYYALLVGLPIVLWSMRQREALADLAFRLLLVYAACALCYLIFPVIGPAPTVPVADALRHGLFFDVSAAVQRAGDSLGTSLPSTHAAGSMTVALACWRWLPRPWAIAITLQACAIALSTVYTQNHYTIDAVAGVLLAIFLQTVVASLSRQPVARATAPARRRALPAVS